MDKYFVDNGEDQPEAGPLMMNEGAHVGIGVDKKLWCETYLLVYLPEAPYDLGKSIGRSLELGLSGPFAGGPCCSPAWGMQWALIYRI